MVGWTEHEDDRESRGTATVLVMTEAVMSGDKRRLDIGGLAMTLGIHRPGE